MPIHLPFASGRILNRFTRDIDLMDNQLIENVPDVFEVIPWIFFMNSTFFSSVYIVSIGNHCYSWYTQSLVIYSSCSWTDRNVDHPLSFRTMFS